MHNRTTYYLLAREALQSHIDSLAWPTLPARRSTGRRSGTTSRFFETMTRSLPPPCRCCHPPSRSRQSLSDCLRLRFCLDRVRLRSAFFRLPRRVALL